tara:strand:- start:6 stop:1034 length:1029 start_codon:yes stop_codon:yes gene_type:complete
MNNIYNVAVLGSTGYVGMELVKLLINHPNININFLGSETTTNEYLTNIEGSIVYETLPKLEKNSSFNPDESDYVFLALPHSISNKYVKNFYGKLKIIDLSSDFRLDNIEDYNQFYGNNHNCSNLLNDFIYGLAEINRNEIINSKNIAIPGCYPTSILLPLIPLLKNNLISNDNIIIDSKSGYSGAGKKFDLNNIKLNKEYNFYNYNTNSHRHVSEIKQELLKYSKNNRVDFSFNPHILPNFRGMMSTIYCDLNKNVKINNVIEILKNFDELNTFIKLVDTNDRLDFFSVQNTNFCKIKIFKHYNENKIILVSAIDNLIKGAAGQAVQCLNISENFDETKSLL